MSRIAFLYPGQGAQEVGMAGDFYEKSEEAKAVLIKPPVYWILMSGKSVFRKMTSWTKQNILRRLWLQPVLLLPVNWKKRTLSGNDSRFKPW